MDDFSLVTYACVIGVFAHCYFHYFEPKSIGELLIYLAFYITIEINCFRLSTYETLLSLVLSLGSFGLSIVVYRIVLPIHSLHHIPGPLFARVTQLCQFYSLYKGRPRVDQRNLHEKYGPVVRIGPNEVSIADAGMLAPVFGAKAWQKGKGYSFTASGGAATSETALSAIREHKEHAARRKIWDRAFSIASLKDYQPSIEARVQQLCDQIDKRCDGRVLDLQEWIGYLVFDVMTDLAWGGGGDALLRGHDPNGAIASLRYSLHLAGMTKALPWFAGVLTRLPWVERRTRQFRTFARDMFLQRQRQRADGKLESRKDVFYHLLGEGSAEGRVLSEGALQADSRQVVTGGADTTVSAITYLFYQLLSKPHHYARLQAHVDEIISEDNDHELNYETIQRSRVLDAYINEAMRLEPPIPYQNQRIAPADGVTVAGVFIPGGTHVRTALYTIARSPANFSDSDEFIPERWLAEKRSADEVFNAKASIPFIQGPYHCVGRNFAMAEMRWTVARLVSRYDMQLAPGSDCDAFERSIEDRSVLEIEGKLDVIVKRRRT